MDLTGIVNSDPRSETINQSREYGLKPRSDAVYHGTEEVLFSQQYLEKPVISGDYQMKLSPTACTIKNIPVIDDF